MNRRRWEFLGVATAYASGLALAIYVGEAATFAAGGAAMVLLIAFGLRATKGAGA